MEPAVDLPRLWRLQALDLETDRTSGPTEFSLAAVAALRQAVVEAWTETAPPAEVRLLLDAYAVRLRRARPTCAPLAARLQRLVAALAQGRDAALHEADRLVQEAQIAEAQLAAAAEPLFRPGLRLLTLGHDTAILKLLLRFADRLELITVTEARPSGDGVRTATALAEQALPVRLITEAQLELVMSECDLALAAAERVLPGGAVVARAGTAVLARVAAAWRVPVYLLAEQATWVTDDNELARFHQERRPPAEVVSSPPQGVEVINIASDLTPAELIAGLITEEGIRPVHSQSA